MKPGPGTTSHRTERDRSSPSLLALHGVGPDTAALLLIAAGWAHLCAVAPIPASSGKVTRRRLNPGDNREANHALVMTPRSPGFRS